jgi:hypothetical protein
MKSIFKLGGIALILTIALSACATPTPVEDPSLKITEIASTVIAEMTQNAALTPSATPTQTPAPTATVAPPTPDLATAMPTATATKASIQGTAAEKAVYVADVTFPDGTIIKPGQVFTKTWRIKNIGTTTWLTAFRLAYLEGLQDKAGLLYVHLPQEVKPETTVDVSVTFTAPNEFGTYYSYWRLVNFEGEQFGEQMSMKIVVGNP